MAYTDQDFKTKKSFKNYVENNGKKSVKVFQPGGLFPLTPDTDGTVVIEGMHYPKAHTWYASCKIDTNNYVIPGTIK
jgi:hypothetical protein